MSIRSVRTARLDRRSVGQKRSEDPEEPLRIRVRFHGRGGQGVKTAGRILGTAAFLSGYHSQDFPVYGAERRGAPVASFARIGNTAIDERGVIPDPDLIVVADETLLADAVAGVLDGQEAASAIFLNSETSDTGSITILPQVVHRDLSKRAIARLGHASNLSAALGAAAARLTGLVSEDQLVEAIREEYAHLRLSADEIQANVDLGLEVFRDLPIITFHRTAEVQRETIASIGRLDSMAGGPNVIHPGNATLRETGAWRLERPVIDLDRCTRCGICVLRCPDGAISLDEEGYPIIDEQHCKGCMICRQICPIHIIDLVQETRS